MRGDWSGLNRVDLHVADLYLVGVGIYELQQMTLETLDVMKRARQILHLTSKHQELVEINPNTRDLGPIYWKPGRDRDIYTEVAKCVVAVGETARPTVFAVEGHPMVFNDISWEIARLGRSAGLRVEAMPAISSIDILPIQLGFDIGDLGVQIYEATQLVIFQLEMNPYLSTLILQIGEFGTSRLGNPEKKRRGFLSPLVSHLCRFFPRDHPAVFIRSMSRQCDPTVVFTTSIEAIDERSSEIGSGMTVYLPRVGIPRICEEAISTTADFLVDKPNGRM